MIRQRLAASMLVLAIAGLGVGATVAIAAESEQADADSAAATQEITDTASICVFSRSDVFARSIVGQKANERMQKLAREARAEVAQGRRQLNADINAFSQNSAGLLQQERQQQRQKLRQRQTALKQTGQRIEARIRYTRDAVRQRLNEQISTIMRAEAKQRSCEIVLDRDSVEFGAQDRDLTSTVVTALNSTVDMINFGLLQLPQLSDKNKPDEKQ